jgi:hypothetical protein
LDCTTNPMQEVWADGRDDRVGDFSDGWKPPACSHAAWA